jgi:hypothetical protein
MPTVTSAATSFATSSVRLPPPECTPAFQFVEVMQESMRSDSRASISLPFDIAAARSIYSSVPRVRSAPMLHMSWPYSFLMCIFFRLGHLSCLTPPPNRPHIEIRFPTCTIHTSNPSVAFGVRLQPTTCRHSLNAHGREVLPFGGVSEFLPSPCFHSWLCFFISLFRCVHLVSFSLFLFVFLQSAMGFGGSVRGSVFCW